MLPGGIDERWLDQANAADLEALAKALEQELITPPFSPSQVQHLGLSAGASTLLVGLSQLGEGMPPAPIAWMLRRLVKERKAADLRWADVASLVWSGPSEGHDSTRDTGVVLSELFGRAEHHVLVSTFVIYDGLKVFAPLVRRMKERPELSVEFYINIKSETGEDEDADVADFVGSFAREQWPAGARLPAIFYDPETLKKKAYGQKQTSLHAKCVVVDERWAFITSANFTEAAQARNIEAGVLLDHPGLASALAGRFRALRDAGKMRGMKTGKTPLPGDVHGSEDGSLARWKSRIGQPQVEKKCHE
jgi:phosphatidylserine/phosphatidylglycerophosphate/cardiolipin synthase-like enzyme